MQLKQILRANILDKEFVAYKLKDKYLVRRNNSNSVFWFEFNRFEEVLKDLEWFEWRVRVEKNEDDSLPF